MSLASLARLEAEEARTGRLEEAGGGSDPSLPPVPLGSSPGGALGLALLPCLEMEDASLATGGAAAAGAADVSAALGTTTAASAAAVSGLAVAMSAAVGEEAG